MATRHQARLAAISLLYSRDMNGGSEDFADEYLEEKRIRNEQRNWTLALLRGASENLAAVDALIDENLKEFKLAEISALERAILRLGAYELRFTDTDAGIVINEAINSAKELGISPRFINGVLDALKDSPVNIEADKISKPNTAGVNSELSTATSENFKPLRRKAPPFRTAMIRRKISSPQARTARQKILREQRGAARRKILRRAEADRLKSPLI